MEQVDSLLVWRLADVVPVLLELQDYPSFSLVADVQVQTGVENLSMVVEEYSVKQEKKQMKNWVPAEVWMMEEKMMMKTQLVVVVVDDAVLNLMKPLVPFQPLEYSVVLSVVEQRCCRSKQEEEQRKKKKKNATGFVVSVKMIHDYYLLLNQFFLQTRPGCKVQKESEKASKKFDCSKQSF